MERRHIPEAENRLIILYTLRQLGPVTAMQLLQAMTEADLMNYITMQLALSDMEQQGQISMRAHPLGNLIEMTGEGDYILDSFLRRIPTSRRKLLDGLAPEWRKRFAAEQMSPAEFFTLADGRNCIHLRLLEKAATLLDLLLYLPAGQHFTLVQDRWRASVEAVYSFVLARLTESYAASAPMPAPQESDTVRQCGANDWLLTLTDEPFAPRLDLMMTLPDEHLARCAAAHWPSVCGDVREFVIHTLEKALG